MHDRVMIVTGGAHGIGRAAALLLAERGARVAVWDRDGTAASAVAAMAQERGAPTTLGLRCDVSDEGEVEAALTATVEHLGAPRGLFCAAGIDIGAPTHELSVELWERVLNTNLRGVFLCCKHVLRAFLADGSGGAIVCTSSPSAYRALPGGTVAYSASKAGISALVRCLAIEYAGHRIRVNAVAPGATETALMWGTIAPDQVEEMRAVIASEVPLGRLAAPDEPARAAVWLLSDEAVYITGTDLFCDGGIMAKAPLSL